jgi:hypothetical protein
MVNRIFSLTDPLQVSVYAKKCGFGSGGADINSEQQRIQRAYVLVLHIVFLHGR